MNTSVWHMIVKYTSQITMLYTLILRFLRQSLCREKESKLRKNCSSEHIDGKILIKEETFRKWLAFFVCLHCLLALIFFVSTPMFSFQCLLLMSLFYSHITFFIIFHWFVQTVKSCCCFFSQPFGSFKECPIKSPHTNLT